MTAGGDDAQVLRERAARLARPSKPPEHGGDSLDLLALDAGGQRCAIELRWLRQVARLRGVGALPLAPAAVLGLAHWEESVLHVLQLSKLLGLPGGEPASHMAVLGVHGRAFALAVDAVEGVIRLPVARARHRSAPIESVRPEIVQGIAEDGRLVLDAERLAALHEIVCGRTPLAKT